MILPLLLLVFSATLLAASVLANRAISAATWHRDLVSLELRFGRDLDAKSVMELFVGLSGLVAPRWRRQTTRALALEVVATDEGVSHRLLLPRSLRSLAISQLRAHLPNLAIDEGASRAVAGLAVAGELGLSTTSRSLRSDDPAAIATGLLAALQPLREGEQLIIQTTLTPVGPQPLPRRQSHATTWATHLFGAPPAAPDPEDTKARRIKQALPLYQGTIRVGASAASLPRAKRLLERVTSAYHAANAPGVHLYRRALPSSWSARALTQRRLPLTVFPLLLNATELTGLVAFPIGGPTLPGLRLGAVRQLPPAANWPMSGRVLARSSYPGTNRLLAVTPTDALSHTHLLGATGVGKSTLLLGLITQDIAAGAGVVVVDPKGDLVRDVLDRIPPERIDDVVIIDPTDEERPVGFNILAGSADQRELVAEQIVSIFHRLYKAFWGPRTDDITRASLLTLLHGQDMTLAEVPLLLTDPSFRARLVGQIDDPVALEPFWAAYEAASPAERAAAIAPLQNKLRAVLMRRRIRNVVGQARPVFDFDTALRERQIVLVPLSKGLLGEDAAALLGSLVVARLWQSVQRRAGVPASQRHPIFAHIDEVQDYLHLPTSLVDVLSQARGLGLGLNLAHQHVDQLTPEMRQAILANARTKVLFKLSSDDARLMARELGASVEPSDLEGLGAFEVVVSSLAHGAVLPPATGLTLPPPPTTGLGAAVRARSRRRFGRDRRDVENELRQRHSPEPGSGRVGHVRRPS